jgi:hypothetical protein
MEISSSAIWDFLCVVIRDATQMALFPLNFLLLDYWCLETSGLTSRGVLLPVGGAGFTQRRCPMVTMSRTSIFGDPAIIPTRILE